MDTAARIEIPIPPEVDVVAVLGANDANLHALETVHPEVSFWLRGERICLQGPSNRLDLAAADLKQLIQHEARRQSQVPTAAALPPSGAAPASTPSPPPPASVTEGASQNPQLPPDLHAHATFVSRDKVIRPLTAGQAKYVANIDAHTITFAIGPAGTGKTYLAMARAVRALLDGEVTRLILTRPAVEAGETLGFLPGTLSDKIDPYLRPLYDALREMLDPATISRMLSDGTIEVAALAYMRGRTLNGAFVILDEAQNTTGEQMKMFLTRLGFNSKMVVTGDITQIDLPSRKSSGLCQVTRILSDVPDIAFSYLDSDDVVRHSLVGEIIAAYDVRENAERSRRGTGN